MSDASPLLTSALLLHQAGRLGEAEEIYRRALSIAPNDAHAWYLLGSLLGQRKEYGQAIDYLRRATSLCPEHAPYLINLAAVYANSGHLQEAAAGYQSVLELDPQCADAHSSLGNVRLQQQQYTAAIRSYQQALMLAPQLSTVSLHLATCLDAVGQKSQACQVLESILCNHATDTAALSKLVFILNELGRGEEAIERCKSAISLAPQDATAHNCLGVACALRKHRDEALASYREALRLNPSLGEAWNNLGAALHEMKQFEEAVAAEREAILLNEGNAAAHYNMADSLRALGLLDDAISHYHRAIELNPDYAEAHNNLGAALQEQGLDEHARDHFAQAVRINPRSAEAFNNLGNILRCLGQPPEALAHIQHAVALRPDFAEAHNNLALTLRDLTQLDEADAELRLAISLNPQYAEAHANLGDLLRDAGMTDDALACYAKSGSLMPQDGLRIKAALAMPIIQQSVEAIDNQRAKLAKELNDLENENLEIRKPVVEIGTTPFYLAYHGRNDLLLQRSLARVCVKATPTLSYQAAAGTLAAPDGAGRRRPRVGFISSLFREHTIGRLNLGTIQQLSREQFEVVLFVFSPPRDRFAEQIYAAAERVVQLPGHLERARELLLAERLDALFYTDIGMEPITYFLAFSRLAPVQCVTWGHPVTTGITAIDYFISDVDLEPAAAEEHYSEQLVRLNHLPTYYLPPELPSPRKTREDFGLDNSRHLYFCAQSLFKLQPDFDALLAGILNTDENAQILLLTSATRQWNEHLSARLARHVGKHFERIRFVPRMTPADFLSLQALVDVSLDTTHFSGGRTSFDAFALGIPVVTLPGEFMRGRVTYACYRKMGFMDCVAATPDEYVRIAVRLANDRAWRDKICGQILARNHLLFENRGFIVELEQFFERAIQEAAARACDAPDSRS